MKFRALVTAVVATLGLVVGLVAGLPLMTDPATAVAPGPVALAAATPCADVLLLAAPGSGEGAATSPTSVGTTAGGAVNTLLAGAGSRGRTVEEHVLDFHSAGLAVLRPRVAGAADRRVAAYQVRRWAVGVDAGVSQALGVLTASANACPDQSIVLVGYAQGAMVMHRLLAGLTSRPAVLRRVLGAVLVSDGDRAPGTRATLLGAPVAARSGRGIATAKIGPVADVPSRGWAGTVWSICRASDIVCDLGATAASTAMVRSHVYHSGDNLARVRSAATILAGRTKRIPQPQQAPEWSADQDVPFQHQLTADVLPRDRGRLTWSAVSGVPPGLSLSASGVVAGQPGLPGSYDLTYTVRNTVAPAYDRPITGHVTLTIAPNQVATLAAGGEDGCSVRANGTLWCWGDNRFAQLGNGTHDDALKATQIGASANWAFVSTGGSHTCAIRTTGSLWCWGMNNFGQLGDGTTTERATATRVGAGPYASVSASWFHTCAVTTAGAAYCWGANGHGQLGNGTTSTQKVPVRVGTGSSWTTIAAGGLGTCGTQADGTAWCWGVNDFGQVGDGTTTQRLTPTRVGTASDWTQVQPSWLFTCGLTTSGAARCWGQNDDGQLGTGTTTDASTPRTVTGGHAYADLAVGQNHACGLTTAGALWCWGTNVTGQLGTGDRAAVNSTPVQPVGAGVMTRLAAGWGNTCGRRTDATVVCWGVNDQGQLGDGTRTLRLTPTVAPGARAANAAASVTPGQLPAAVSTDPVSFTLMTFNSLGSAHTDPTGDEPGFAPGRLRIGFAADIVRARTADVVGWQELQPDQLQGIEEAAPGYDFYPRLAAGNLGAQTNLMWRSSRFRLVRASTYNATVLGKTRPFPYVKLADLATGRMFWVINAHNSPGAQTAERDAQVATQTSLVNQLSADGIPVYLVGDFNALRRPFCLLVGRTDLAAANGGTATTTSCSPPPAYKIDWIFGSLSTFAGYVADRGPLVTHSTDHHVVSARVTFR